MSHTTVKTIQLIMNLLNMTQQKSKLKNCGSDMEATRCRRMWGGEVPPYTDLFYSPHSWLGALKGPVSGGVSLLAKHLPMRATLQVQQGQPQGTTSVQNMIQRQGQEAAQSSNITGCSGNVQHCREEKPEQGARDLFHFQQQHSLRGIYSGLLDHPNW